jgi:hypothetical protein
MGKHTGPDGYLANYIAALTSTEKDEVATELALVLAAQFGLYSVKSFGAKGDGTTDDTAAINAAIAAIPEAPNSFDGAYPVLFFPEGRYITQGGHVIPSEVRCIVKGAGVYSTILYKKAAAAGDILTVNGDACSVQDIALDGYKSGAATGDGLVINGAGCLVRDTNVFNCSGDNIALGKAGGSTTINSSFSTVTSRLSGGFGILVYAGAHTDISWYDINVGLSGKSGMRINAPSHKLTAVHAWGSGIESTTDKHGIDLNSGNHVLNGCVCETNTGNGIFIGRTGTEGNSISGSTIWGNVGNGIGGFNTNKHVITGNIIKNNGVANTAGNSSVNNAAIQCNNGQEWVVSGNSVFDDGTAISAPSYGTAPPYPYPGRTAQLTQSMHYGEINGSNRNTIVGNGMSSARSRTGLTIVAVGKDNVIRDNNLGAVTVPSVASAATITLPALIDFITVTGTVGITSITASYPGRVVTLQFSNASPGQVTDGSNLKLNGNFVPTTDDTLTLVCDGTNWVEIARSAN